MSKSSTVTVRERPVEEVATAKVGGLTIHGETLVIRPISGSSWSISPIA